MPACSAPTSSSTEQKREPTKLGGISSHGRGSGLLGTDAVVPALARLDPLVLEAGGLADMAQPAEMV
ncbi:MAG: hypothetical protein ACJ8H8_32245 [Geminicoccaceae bacterium]